jgi:hypothetical protein
MGSMIYTWEEHLKPRVEGGWWEHVEPMDLRKAVNVFAACSLRSVHGHFKHPDGYSTWAHYFLSSGQGGGLTGEGYAFVYGSGGYWDRNEPTKWVGREPTAYRVAICKHEKVEGAGARPNFGWHLGKCAKCGLDMTVDSGD